MGRVGRTSARGQTPVDFVAGMGVFVVAVGFVVWFVPDLFVPLDGESSTPMIADRVASQVAGPLLGEATPGTLNETCTLAFFGTGAASDCGFTAGAPPGDVVGVDAPYAVNVTFEGPVAGSPDTAVRCADGAAIEPCEPGDAPLATGPTPPSSGGDVTVVRRPVSVGGEYGYVVVRVWI